MKPPLALGVARAIVRAQHTLKEAKGTVDHEVVYEVLDKVRVADDEWMYQPGARCSSACYEFIS